MMGQIEVLYDLGEPYVRLEDYRAVQARAATLAAEVKRLTALYDACVTGVGTLDDEIAALRAEVGRLQNANASLSARLEIVGGRADDNYRFAVEAREEASELEAAVAALRAQLAAGGGWRTLDALASALEIACCCIEDKRPLRTDDGAIKIFRWHKRASEPAFAVLDAAGWLDNLGNGTFVVRRPAPPQE